MITNVYKHNSRSYYDVYNPLVAAYPRKPTWIFKELAGMFDFQSELMNIIATDILYPMTRESAYSFANRCDYTPTEADGATDTLTITLTSAKAKTLATGYQVGGISASTGKTVIYELTAIGNSNGSNTIIVAAKQQKTITSVLVGTITSSDDFSDYPIDGYTNILKDSISLNIDGLAWTRVDNFDDSDYDDRHFTLIYQSSGKCRIGFGSGDGISSGNGMKPTQNSNIYATFAVTEGLTGRMDVGEITINLGGDNDISTITNNGSEGGNDSESVASIIRNARGNVRLRNMVWSVEDLETAARSASSSVIKALGISNTPSVGEATIYIVPSGGGALTGTLDDDVRDYVTELTQFGAMPVTVSGTWYDPVNIYFTYSTRTGYDAGTVNDLASFALTLSVSAIDNQVTEYYDDNGINSCRINVINTLWDWNFTEDENNALEFIIEKWQELLSDSSKSYREYGQECNIGDLWVMLRSLSEYGVDNPNILSPNINITINDYRISNAGIISGVAL
jgi:hypothetical protein